MGCIKSFDKNHKQHILAISLFFGVLAIVPFVSWADEQRPVEVPSNSQETTTVRMVGTADQPPPVEEIRAEVVTMPLSAPPPVVSAPDPAPVQTQPLRTIVESPPPPTPVSPSPVVETGTIAPVQRPDSYSISSFGSASSGSGVPAPQVYNGYQAPPSDFLQGGSNYQAPVRQSTIRRVIVPPVSDRYQAPPSTFIQGGSNYQAPVRQSTIRKTQAQLANENSRIIDQARTLYLSGDKQGAERLIQSLPVDEQVYTREYVTHGGGVENVGLTDEQATDITMAILDPRKKGKFVVNVVENIEKKAKKQFFKNTKEATEAAVLLGYKKIRELSNGEAVYKKGNSYITRDIGSGNGLGSHNGGAWKEANSVKNLGTAETRNGTFDADLNWVGK
jgi:hypothetical protein